mgnify:CR=1 FL=1
MAWRSSGATDLPLAGADRDWDGDEATDALFKLAGKGDDFDESKVRQGHFAYDSEASDQQQGYKLPFATVIDGELKAVPRAIYAVTQVLEGGRGGVDLPDEVQQEIREKVEKYYRRMGEDPPW